MKQKIFRSLQVILMAVVLTLMMVGQPAIAAEAKNIVVNGTFDSNNTGWTGSYSLESGPSGGFPVIDSQSYFWAGNVPKNIISQTYNLSSTYVNYPN